jgi:hypothetical protein
MAAEYSDVFLGSQLCVSDTVNTTIFIIPHLLQSLEDFITYQTFSVELTSRVVFEPGWSRALPSAFLRARAVMWHFF